MQQLKIFCISKTRLFFNCGVLENYGEKNQKNTYNLNSRFTIHDFKIQDHINEIDISCGSKGKKDLFFAALSQH